MATKRPAAAAASGSEASDAEADAPHHQPSSPSLSKTTPPNPNPKSAAAAAAPASASAVAEASAAAGSDTEGSDADHRSSPGKAAVSPSRRPRSPKPRSRSRSRSLSPDAGSDSDGFAAPAASDADDGAGAGADSDDGNASPLPPPRPSRAEAAAIKPISSRPMDPPRRSVPSFSEPRPKRPRSAAVPSSVEQLKRPSRLWSPVDELVILRDLVAYRAKRGVLPASMHDIGKLHGLIRGQLSVKVTTTQLSDKVRRLKQKYHILAARAKNGRDPDLPTPHDHSVYELGKKIWGASADAGVGGSAGGGYENAGGGESEEEHESGESDGGMESGRDHRGHKNRRLRPITMPNGNGTGIRAVNANSRGKVEFEKGKDAFPYLWETVEDLSREHPNGVAFKKAFELIEGPKARGIEEKLRKFRLTEIRHQLRRMELMKETVKMLLDALEG
ncbi:STOREKEEPER protein-like [Phragmites australis]|uniref:STOREKEEPER protein-like n=1 Tax=Phragmites australis TaxID=29695 RepID=UPI002D79A77F|nr:STOREKEEPER protein-like [Phragmites australis]